MAEIKQLKKGDKVIYPITSTKAIVDENGNRVSIPTNTSELTNDSGFVTSEELATAISQSIINTLNTEV